MEDLKIYTIDELSDLKKGLMSAEENRKKMNKSLGDCYSIDELYEELKKGMIQMQLPPLWDVKNTGLRNLLR
jgi:hypothetical protein